MFSDRSIVGAQIGLGEDSGIYQGKVEENVQYGPPAPLYSVPVPAFFGTKDTFYWVAGGLVGAWLLYTYVFKGWISDESQY
jgi:hypothetical protein